MKNLTTVFLCIIIGFSLWSACQNNNTSTEATNAVAPNSTVVEATTSKTTSPIAEKKEIPLQTKDLLYSWVEKLNLREAPNTKAKIVATVEAEEALEFSGERSEKNETIVLRGVVYKEPWFKVLTKDQVTGWVFGGAVKRPEEQKGNASIEEDNFDFPHFGNFNLKDWKKGATKNESGGDAEIKTTIYKLNNQILEIVRVEVGEYGYSRTYNLMDSEKKLLKARTLDFSVDETNFVLTEIVEDHTSKPAKKYTRSQQIQKHFMQLNAYPEMVLGKWKEGTLDASSDD